MVILMLVIWGLCLGSFVNALVWRVYKQENSKSKKAKQKYSIANGRSMCPACKHTLAPRDLVPVLSWLMLRGKCRYCRKPIQDTPLAELLTPVLFVVSYFYWPLSWTTQGRVLFGFWLIFLVGFVALALYDIRWYILPDRMVFPLMGLAGLQLAVQVVLFAGGMDVVTAAFWGVAMGGGIFWLLFRLSDGNWIGGGDVKLGLLLGALVGGPLQALLLIFVASLVGTAVSLPLMGLKGLKKSAHIPFGPFLLVAAIIVRLFGPEMVQWYKGLAGL